MREQIEQLLDTLDERQQKIMLGVLVERFLQNLDEEIEFTVQATDEPIGCFVPTEIRRELDYARWIAELDHPDGLPDEHYILEKSGIKQREPSPAQ